MIVSMDKVYRTRGGKLVTLFSTTLNGTLKPVVGVTLSEDGEEEVVVRWRKDGTFLTGDGASAMDLVEHVPPRLTTIYVRVTYNEAFKYIQNVSLYPTYGEAIFGAPCSERVSIIMVQSDWLVSCKEKNV